MIRRREVLYQTAGCLSAALMIGIGRGHAESKTEEFPSRQITLIVPFAAGGPTDSVARLVASTLSEDLGQPVIVENRPGGSTLIAARAVARSAPDGYTLMAFDISCVVAPHLSSFDIDVLNDFKAVGQSVTSQLLLIVSPTLSTATIGDFIKLAKEKPQSTTIGHPGIGSTPHVAAITFMKAAGINPILVPYRGQANATNDLLGGQISAIFTAIPLGAGLAKSNAAQALGVTGEKRSSALPDVPTFDEIGIRMTGFERGSWYGIVSPPKTPDNIIAKLNGALNKLGQNTAIKVKLNALGLEPSTGTPHEFQALIQTQYKYWGDMLRLAGIASKN